MPLKTVRDVLVAAPAVTTIAGQRISPVMAAQNVPLPFVTLAVLGTEPMNDLHGYSGLDVSRVLVTAWAETYEQCLTLATACRSALESAGHLCESRDADQFNADPDPGLYRIEHQFVVYR